MSISFPTTGCRALSTLESKSLRQTLKKQSAEDENEDENKEEELVEGALFFVSTNEGQFLDVEPFCGQVEGGNPASIQNDEEFSVIQEFLVQQNVSGNAWIGLTKSASEERFSWTDGSEVEFGKDSGYPWGTGEPNFVSSGEDVCTRLVGDGAGGYIWDDTGCTLELNPVVCRASCLVANPALGDKAKLALGTVILIAGVGTLVLALIVGFGKRKRDRIIEESRYEINLYEVDNAPRGYPNRPSGIGVSSGFWRVPAFFSLSSKTLRNYTGSSETDLRNSAEQQKLMISGTRKRKKWFTFRSSGGRAGLINEQRVDSDILKPSAETRALENNNTGRKL